MSAAILNRVLFSFTCSNSFLASGKIRIRAKEASHAPDRRQAYFIECIIVGIQPDETCSTFESPIDRVSLSFTLATIPILIAVVFLFYYILRIITSCHYV